MTSTSSSSSASSIATGGAFFLLDFLTGRGDAVLTGVSSREDIATAEARPDLVFTDLNAVLSAIQSPVE